MSCVQAAAEQRNPPDENIDATELRDREWWAAESRRTGTDWPSIASQQQQALTHLRMTAPAAECPSCGCAPCPTPSFCRTCIEAGQRKAAGQKPRYVAEWTDWPEAPDRIPANWDSSNVTLDGLWSRLNDNRRQRYGGAPQSTYWAALYELRTYGAPQLSKPDCQRRLGDLSTAQLRGLIAALIRLRPEYPKITDELIEKLGAVL
jgi:hypothetical protein